jgi:hypothetical protein
MATKAFLLLEEIFTAKITVLTIAVPINPLPLEQARKECIKNNFDVHLIRDPDQESLMVYCRMKDRVRALNDSEVIADSTPMLEVLESLYYKEQLFVKVKRNITHIVSRSDIDKIPIRIWLYGIISLFEIELKEIIKIVVNDWEKKISEKRLDSAKRLFALKKERNEEIDLLGCVQLVDVGTIVNQSWDCFKDYFPVSLAKAEVTEGFEQINILRDTLAHGQKLPMDWPVIHKLAQLISFSLEKF